MNRALSEETLDLYEIIERVNRDSSAKAKFWFEQNEKPSKLKTFIKAISIFFHSYFSMKGSITKRFYASFANAFNNFLANLKLLKLYKKI